MAFTLTGRIRTAIKCVQGRVDGSDPIPRFTLLPGVTGAAIYLPFVGVGLHGVCRVLWKLAHCSPNVVLKKKATAKPEMGHNFFFSLVQHLGSPMQASAELPTPWRCE